MDIKNFTAAKIRFYRKAKGLTQKELGEKIGVKHNTVSGYESGTNEPEQNILFKIAAALEISINDLFPTTTTSPTQPHSPDDLPSPPAKDVTFPLNDTHRVPIIGTVRCGPGGLAYEHIDEYMTIDASYNPDEMRGFRAEGDSMIGDGIYDGDLCLICLQPEVENGAIAVVVIDGEEGCLKHITVDKTNGVVVLSSSNPAYPQRIFTGASANDVRIVGKLIEVRHRF